MERNITAAGSVADFGPLGRDVCAFGIALTPHGLATVQRWLGLGSDRAPRPTAARTQERLCAEPARAMA